MRIFKTVALLFVCLSLFTAGAAQAAMTCCMPGSDMQHTQMQHSDSDMQYHKTASKHDSKHHHDCQKCCNGCTALNMALPNQKAYIARSEQAQLSIATVGFTSYHTGIIDSPPKHIS